MPKPDKYVCPNDAGHNRFIHGEYGAAHMTYTIKSRKGNPAPVSGQELRHAREMAESCVRSEFVWCLDCGAEVSHSHRGAKDAPALPVVHNRPEDGEVEFNVEVYTEKDGTPSCDCAEDDCAKCQRALRGSMGGGQ